MVGLGGRVVKNCRGRHRICREDVDTRDPRTDRVDRPRAWEGKEACGDFS